MALVILALGILALGIMTVYYVLTPISWYFYHFKNTSVHRLGVFSVSGIPQKWFQNTLENTIEFCLLEWVVFAFLKIMVVL